MVRSAGSLHKAPFQADTAQAQTPQQRKANERYAKQEASKRGKPESEIKQKQKFKPPISPLWIGTYLDYPFIPNARPAYAPLGLLAFVVCGGLIFELLRLFF